jgi:hypothetical protein
VLEARAGRRDQRSFPMDMDVGDDLILGWDWISESSHDLQHLFQAGQVDLRSGLAKLQLALLPAAARPPPAAFSTHYGPAPRAARLPPGRLCRRPGPLSRRLRVNDRHIKKIVMIYNNISTESQAEEKSDSLIIF